MEQIDHCLRSVDSFRSARAVHFYLHSKIILKKKTTNKWHRHKSQKENLAKAKQKKKLTTFYKKRFLGYKLLCKLFTVQYLYVMSIKLLQSKCKFCQFLKTTTCEMKHYNLQLYKEQRRNFHWPSSAAFKISFIKSNRQVLYWDRIQVSRTCRRQRREKFSDIVCYFSLQH